MLPKESETWPPVPQVRSQVSSENGMASALRQRATGGGPGGPAVAVALEKWNRENLAVNGHNIGSWLLLIMIHGGEWGLMVTMIMIIEGKTMS